MSALHEHPLKPGALSAPRRNNYYFGKLMDVVHFELEQNYGNSMRRLLNRLSLGEGVLCGLLVEKSADGLQICVTAGVAIDSLGREIIVPKKACIDPWTLTDECGQPGETLKKDEPHLVHLCLAYRECGADFAPVLVEDCNLKTQCAPGTIVESFRLLVQEKVPAPPADTSAICAALLGAHSAYEIVATADTDGKPVAVAVSPDGQHALVADEKGPSLYAIDIESGAVTGITGAALTAPIGGVAVARNGGLFFVSHKNGIATVDFSTSPATIGSLVTGNPYGRCEAMNGGSVVFAINLGTKKVQRFDGAAAPTDLATVTLVEPALLALSSDGKSLYVADAQNKKLVRVDTATNASAALTDPAKTPKTLAIRPGDPAAHLAGDKYGERIPDTGASESFTLNGDAAASAFTSGGGRYHVISRTTGARELIVFRAGEMSEIARVPLGEEPTSIAVVPDSRRVLVTDSKSGTISIIDVVPRQRLCEKLSGPCPQPEACPCVTLATIELRKDGTIGAIDACGHRQVLYSNEMLLEFILCLAARLEECCGGVVEPLPKPLEPEPPPEVQGPFRITKIDFLTAGGIVVGALDDLTPSPSFRLDRRVAAIRVTFNRAVDVATVTAAPSSTEMAKASFLVRRANQPPFVRGNIVADGANAVRFVTQEPNTFPVGDYAATLFGDADPPHSRPAIADTTASHTRLDGERGASPSGLPSGDGSGSGTFKFKFGIIP